MEILANNDRLGAQTVDQDLPGELVSSHLSLLLVEPDHTGCIYTGCCEQFEFLFHVGEQLGCRLGSHHRRGMPVEGDDDTLATHRLRQCANLGDYRLVSAMYAVVRTDGDD